MTSVDKDWSQLLATHGDDAAYVHAEVLDFAADQEQAQDLLRDVNKYLEVSASTAAELRSFRAQPLALGRLLSVARCSRYGLNLILRDYRRFWGIIQSRGYQEILERDELVTLSRSTLVLFQSYERKVHALLRFYQYHILRIMIGDLGDDLGFEATVRELSDLAESVVQGALDIASERLQARYGLPTTGFCVLGLGKLGGRELNYSSDLDFVFLYGEDGQTQGGAKQIDHQEFFRRLGKELISILDEPKAGGRLFRIDMRLRPEGTSGELVLSRRATADYYYTKGRAWERQAMIKARPIAGDLDLGWSLLEELRPWVFPREQSLEQMENARVMRRRIEERADVLDVKTGAGGIRDIEFLVQSFQLAYGGIDPDLRHRSTLPVLRRLGALHLIRGGDAIALEEHYIWLRHVEHRLQLWEARQLHAVPDSHAERLHLARRCGCDPADPLGDFERRLQATRREVRALAEHYYLTGTGRDDTLFCLLTGEEPGQAVIEQALGDVGFHDPARAARLLRDLAAEPFFVLNQQRTERTFLAILPELLRQLAASPDANRTLEEFARIVAAVGGRCFFFEEMAKRPHSFRALVNLAGWATYLIGYLQRFPGLVDDLFEHDEELLRWTPEDLRQARAMLGSQDDYGSNLAYLHARELVHIAWTDLQGEAPERIMSALSDLARAVFQLALEREQARLDAQLGRPLKDGARQRFAVLGLGKLGGGELSYASDMDVIFVADGGGSCARRGHDAEVYWKRLAQRVIGVLGEHKIYEIDPRLRPWGEQGPLIVSMSMLERYWSDQRDLWERLAHTRISVLAGDEDLGREARDLIHRKAIGQPLPDDAVERVRRMRARLEDSVAGRDHLKRGRGGYVDIEFAVQYLCLRCRPEELPPGLGTRSALAHLRALGRITAEGETAMIAALAVLRHIENRMRLAQGRAVSSIPTDAEDRQRIARQSGYTDAAAMDTALHHAREQARRWFDELLR